MPIAFSVIAVLVILSIIAYLCKKAKNRIYPPGIYLANPLSSANYKDMSHLIQMIKQEEWFGYKFMPDAELLAFATAIGENISTIERGIYVSSPKDPSYRIELVVEEYRPVNPHVDFFIPGILISIGNDLDKIEFIVPKNRNKKIKKEFVFYLVLWCFCFIHRGRIVSSKDKFTFEFVDHLIAEFILTTTTDIKPLLEGLYHFLFEIHGDLNRYTKLSEYIILSKKLAYGKNK